VSSPLLLALLGLLYVLIFGGMSVLRREGASTRFAIESVVITAIVAGAASITGWAMNPGIFLVLLYLITMRVRLLIDLGNLFARRDDRASAERVYRLALRLWPDEAGRLIVQLNQGVLALHSGRVDDAIATLSQVWAAAGGGYLGVRYQSACRYNLGVAFQRKGLAAQATLEYNAVIDNWPASEYARYAAIALKRQKEKS
jgi:tetratricopeptide (TPR) repeat protein